MKVTATIAIVLALIAPPRASASDEDDPEENGSAPAEAETDFEAATDVEAQTTEPPGTGTTDARAWSFGPYLRYAVVPAFMLQLFVDLAPSVAQPAFGATARYRSKADGPAIELGLGYASYAFDGAFRTKGGNLNDTEWVESSLGLLHVSGSVVWDAPLSEQFAFEYGVGLDFGIVTGELVRTEAFVDASGQFGKCPGVILQPNSLCQPPRTAIGTDPSNVQGEQYNVVDAGVPPVMGMPMLPRVALRYAPSQDLLFRIEAAYGIAQVWLGLSAAYAPEL